MTTLFVGTVLAESACKTSGPSCDAKAQAAMNYMYSHFGPVDAPLHVWINHSYDAAGKRYLEQRENKFERLADWARTLPEADKTAYLAIIDTYEDGAKEAYSEWHTHELQKSQLAYVKHLQECAEAVRAAEKIHPLPTPPESLLINK